MLSEGIKVVFSRHSFHVAVVLFIFCASLVVYFDTVNLHFNAETYYQINAHVLSLESSPFGPLFTSTHISPRFRPVNHYTLALEYRLFKTSIWLYRLLNLAVLTTVGFLVFMLSQKIMQNRVLPSLAAAVFAVIHFSRGDVFYNYCAQFFLFADILFLLLILVIFEYGHMK